MSSRATATTTSAMSRTSQSTSQRRHRSRSTSRYADLEKPKKKKTLSATTSLVSIPNTIKLSMLNSGLLSFDKFKLEARDENNSLSQTIPDKPIELRHFVKLCEQRRKFAVLYKLEFQTAIKVETNSCRHATRKNNVEKNQNQRCIPYDYNRVVLEKLDGLPDSDYVNASYVDSLLKPNAYIVTQGPTEETVLNFWRMIWQENVSCIVMLTKTFDFTKVMCVQYWPPSKDKDESYGDIFLGIAKEEQLANFHIRTFHVYKKNGDKIIEERELLQFHYTEWHSHTCPFSNAILEFRRRVRSVVGNIIKENSHVGPMLVHCNDGGGRSGVYLAIDANMELAEEEDCFHVYGYLKKLRQSRKGLIENVDQYKFVYDTLEEYIVCGNSWFPVSQLSERLKQKSQKEPITKMNEYQREYAQICKQTPRFSIGDCAGGHRADNREKNRDVLCVPPDNFRPYLTSFQGNAFTDYINSVFVDGYTRPREYIVTEWPLKQTLGEFWSLVYDHECSAVVVLCQPPHNSQQYPSFWPESKTPKKYGPVFTVGHRSHHHYTNIKTWLFEINKKIISLTELMAGVKAPSKTVQLFQLTCWPMGHKVPSSTNSLVALMNMVERWRQRSDYGPVCVVSPDGRSRSGVYCAANACIEQVIQHGEVDIFQAVKTVRRHRPQLVENITEYKYCYDLVLHYVLHYLNKDLKEKKFIEFGRGKSIPLTPENSNSDLPNEMSNAGRIVVKKRISKIEKCESFNNCDNNIMNNSLIGFSGGLILNPNMMGNKNSGTSNSNVLKKQASLMLDKNGKVVERKKKGRLYSLGGNEPPKSKHRGRLDRLKTVGTFDLGAEMCVLSEVARHLNERIITSEPPKSNDETSTDNNNLNTNCNNNNNNSISNLSPANSIAGSIIQGSKSGLSTPQHGVRHDNLNIIYNNKSICVPPFQQQQQQQQLNSLLDGNQQQPKLRSLSTGSYLSSSNNSSHSNSNLLYKIEIDNPDDLATPNHHTHPHHLTSSSSCNNTILRSRKPQLRKSKRIIRSDSEILTDDIPFTSYNSNSVSNEIILNINTDIQIHQEQSSPIDDDLSSRHLPKSRLSSGEHNTRELLKSTTDESSRNISTDELDTVFSDSRTDLEQLEKDYRENIKSNLTQREYKSDGDTLDEIGRKRNEFGKWKNQSFDNDIDCFPIVEINNNTDNNKDSNSSNLNRPTDLEIKSNSVNSSSIINTTTVMPATIPTCQKPSSEGSITSLLEKRFSKFKRMNQLLKSKRFSTSILYEKNKIKSTSNITRTEEVIRIPNSYHDHNQQPHFFKTAERRQSKISLFPTQRKSSIISGHSSLSNNELNFNLPNANNNSSNSSIRNPSADNYSKSHTEINNSKLSLFRSSPFHFNNKKIKTNKSADNNGTKFPKTLNSPLSEEFYNKTGSVRLSAVELFEKFCSEDFGGLYKHEIAATVLSNTTSSVLHNQRISQRGLGAIRKYTTQQAANTNASQTNQNHPPRLLKQKSEPKFRLRNIDNSEMKEVMYYHEEEEDEQEAEIYSNEDEDEDLYETEDEEDEEGEEYEYEDDDDEIDNDEELDEIYLMPQPIEEPIETENLPTPSTQAPNSSSGSAHKSQLNSKVMGSSSSSRPPLIRVAGIDRSLNNLNNTNNLNEFNFNFDNDDEILTIYRVYSKNDIINLTNSDLNLNTNTSMIDSADRHNKLTKSTPSFLNYINNVDEFNQYNNNVNNNSDSDAIENEHEDEEEPKFDPNFIKTNILETFNDSFELLSSNNNRSGSTITSIDYCFDTVKNLNLDSCSTSKLSLSLKSEIFDEYTITPDELKLNNQINNNNVATIKNCEIEDFTLTPDENSYNDDIIIDDDDDDDDGNAYSSKAYDKSTNIEKVIKMVDKFIINEKNISSSNKNAMEEIEPMVDGDKNGEVDIDAAQTFLKQNQLNLNSKNIFNFENIKLLKLSTSTEYNDSSENQESTEIDDDGCCAENKVSSYTNKITKEFDLLFYRAEEESKILLNNNNNSNNNNNNNNSDHNSIHNNSHNNRMPTRYSMQKLEPITILDYPCESSIKLSANDTTGDGVNVDADDEADINGDKHDGDIKQIYRENNVKKSRSLCARLTTHRSQSLGNLNKKTRCFPL